MEGSGSSSFDMSKMSTAEKLLAGGSILLLIDSFFPWQFVDLGPLDDLIGGVGSTYMWQGSGSISECSRGSSRSRSSSPVCSR